MLRIIIIIAVLLFVALSHGGPAQAEDLSGFGPYIMILSPDSVMICAYLDVEVSAYVQLENSGSVIKSLPLDGFQPGCVVFSDLSADESYAYRLFTDGREVTDSRHPPVFVISPNGTQTVAVMGDTRSGDNSFDLEHRQIVQTVLNEVYPDAVIHTGDFVERDELSLWRNFFLIEKDLLASTPIYPSLGRSDQPARIMRRLFPILNEKAYYSFDRGPAHFVILNLWRSSSQTQTETAENGEQAQWLRADIAAARERGSRYVFMVMHEVPFDIDGGTPRAVRSTYMPIIENFGVTAVFSGAHYFSHKIRNGVHYFTNGGGGAVLETKTPPPDLFMFYRSIHHFMSIEIGPSGVKIRAVDSRGNTFYEVGLEDAAGDRRNTPINVQSSAVTVKSFAGGEAGAAMTVYYDPAGSAEAELLTLLPQIASQSGVTLVVTFRSLADSSNRAVFDSLDLQDVNLPTALIGDDVLQGMENIRNKAGVSAQRESRRVRTEHTDGKPLLLWIGTALALLFIISSLWLRFRRR